MRLSIDDDYGADSVKASLIFNCEVRLNGEVIDYVVLADEEEGMLERYRKDESGNFVYSGFILERETLLGKVEIIDLRKTK